MRLHLTNARGVGVVEFMRSLLPHFLELDSVSKIWGPCDSWFLEMGSKSKTKKTVIFPFRRTLPNSISRFLECTFMSGEFEGDSPLIVFGDIPLRVRCKQILFLQNCLLLGEPSGSHKVTLKLRVQKWLLRINLRFVDQVIVQTNVMKKQFCACFPTYHGGVYVVSQPAQSWLLDTGKRRKVRVSDGRLRLMYPAANYQHKNHRILLNIDEKDLSNVCEIWLSVSELDKKSSQRPFLKMLGPLDSAEMVALYDKCDALLFLSLCESYGFPLVEAMHIGIPIICPDLPYAHELCGDQAIYFNPNSAESLVNSIKLLQKALKDGWYPNWEARLEAFPKSWSIVANEIITIARMKKFE